MRLEDVLLSEDIQQKDLNIYKFPDSNLLLEKNVKAFYLGYFFPWNGSNSYNCSSTGYVNIW